MTTKTLEDKAYWIKHIEAYRRGNFRSKTAYCVQTDVDYHRFIYWHQKIIREAANNDGLPRKSLFMPVQATELNQAPKPAGLLCTLEFRQGHKLKVHDESLFEKLINLLSK